MGKLTLEQLDELWNGKHSDKIILKRLCRKYSPNLIMEWIHRGLTILNKDKVAEWHENKLKELGKEVLPIQEDEPLVDEDYGDYFSD